MCNQSGRKKEKLPKEKKRNRLDQRTDPEVYLNKGCLGCHCFPFALSLSLRAFSRSGGEIDLGLLSLPVSLSLAPLSPLYSLSRFKLEGEREDEKDKKGKWIGNVNITNESARGLWAGEESDYYFSPEQIG